MAVFEQDRVASRIHQGSRPPIGTALRRLGFDVVVLCDDRYQRPQSDFAGVLVIHAPLHETLDFPADEEKIALDASRRAARCWLRGERVLVTCRKGRNRSGLVTSLLLCEVFGYSGIESVFAIRAARKNALTNDRFVELLAPIEAHPARRGLLAPRAHRLEANP